MALNWLEKSYGSQVSAMPLKWPEKNIMMLKRMQLLFVQMPLLQFNPNHLKSNRNPNSNTNQTSLPYVRSRHDQTRSCNEDSAWLLLMLLLAHVFESGSPSRQKLKKSQAMEVRSKSFPPKWLEWAGQKFVLKNIRIVGRGSYSVFIENRGRNGLVTSIPKLKLG